MKNYIIAFFILVIGSIALLVWYENYRMDRVVLPVTEHATTTITKIAVEKPYFIVYGNALSHVEIWSVPTGTGITESEHVKVGVALSMDIDEDSVKRWIYPIPQEPILATEIYARGFDNEGNEIGRVSLSYTGATELYKALWATSEHVTLTEKESATVNGVRITFEAVTEDSRCPANANCIWQGQVIARIKLKVGNISRTVTLSSNETYAFESRSLRIVNVEPQKVAGRDISNYRITFEVTE